MVSRYSIIQYVPDPIASERINLGVLVFDEDEIRVRFLESWKRVYCFGAENIDFLRDFAARMNNAVDDGLFVPGEPNTDLSPQERLLKISQEWQNVVQITPPRKSLGDLEIVLDEVASIFLKEPSLGAKSVLRDRHAAAQITKSTVRQVLKRRFQKKTIVRDLLNSNNSILGRRESHQFDATVVNGRPYFAVHGVSFEVNTPKSTTEAVSWMISDVRDRNKDIPLAVMVLPPKPKTLEYKNLMPLYERKIELYQELGARILGEQDLESWAEEQLGVSL
jgi:hypothetical protein